MKTVSLFSALFGFVFIGSSQIEITYQGVVTNEVIITDAPTDYLTTVVLYVHNLGADADTFQYTRTQLVFDVDWQEQIIDPEIGYPVDDDPFWYAPASFVLQPGDSGHFKMQIVVSSMAGCIINKYEVRDVDSNVVGSFNMHFSTFSEACYLGISQDNLLDCQVFFNATNQTLNVSIPVAKAELNLYNLSGQLVQNQSLTSELNVVQLSDLPDANYIVVVSDNQGKQFRKKIYLGQ